METFYSKIDKKKTKKEAKSILEEYAKLLNMLSEKVFDLGVQSVRYDLVSFSSYVNADAKLLGAIDKKDKNYDELIDYISGVQKKLNLLDLEQINIINLFFLKNLNVKEISKKINRSERTTHRRFAMALIDFAVIMEVAIYTKKH